MKAKLDSLAFYSEDVRAVKEISLDDISSLLIRSYENTVDWIEGSTHNDAKNAIESALQGVYGEFQPEASGVLCDGEGLPVSGILSSIY